MEKKDKTSKLVKDLMLEEQRMIEWLEAHPIIYNKKMTTFMDSDKKEQM